MTTKIIHQVDGTCQTTDGTTATTICSFQLPTGMSCKITGNVVGQQSTNSAAAAREVSVINNSGTATIVGTQVDLLTMVNGSSAALSTAALSFTVATDTITFKVTGVAATTINWFGYIEVLGYVP